MSCSEKKGIIKRKNRLLYTREHRLFTGFQENKTKSALMPNVIFVQINTTIELHWRYAELEPVQKLLLL